MKLKLLALTPVHIGTGIDLEPYEYIVHKGMFSRISQDRAFSLCLEKHPDFPEKFFPWIDDRSTKLNDARSNQEQNRIISGFNIREFILRELNDKELADAVIRNGSAYTCPAKYGFTVNRKVSECIKSAGNLPYIPGSSIKGVIKTALLYRGLTEMPPADATALVLSVKKTQAWKNPRGSRGLDEPLLRHFFICGVPGQAGGRTDALYDLMKFIRVADAEMVAGEMAVFPANIILPDKEPQKQLNPQEAVTRGSVFSFSVTVPAAELKTIIEKKHPGWTELQSKFKRLFGCDIASTPADRLEAEVVKSIGEALRKFSEAQLPLEEKWFEFYRHRLTSQGKDVGTNADPSVIKRFYESFKVSKPYLRIGWGSGFQATTVYAMLLGSEALKDFALEMFRQYGIGRPPGRDNADMQILNLKKFPKSRRVSARDTKHPVYPFGWMVMLGEGEEFALPVIDEEEERYFLGIGAPEAPKKEVKLTEKEYLEKNQNRTYAPNEVVEAKFALNQGRTIAILICDPRYRSQKFLDKPLMFSYGDADKLKKEVIFRVRVRSVKNGMIEAVDFHSFIGV